MRVTDKRLRLFNEFIRYRAMNALEESSEKIYDNNHNVFYLLKGQSYSQVVSDISESVKEYFKGDHWGGHDLE